MINIQTNFGDISIELDLVNTPITSENFLNYTRDGFYDRTIFHRVINGFMIQGGGLLPNMKEKITEKPIINEADNGSSNLTGTIAMARTSDPHSATAQFFINVVDNKFLDYRNKTEEGWGYCVFGKVVSGMDVVNKIKAVKTTRKKGHDDVPVEDIIIEKVIVAEDKS
jgi:peptidyl-prolyl cis-trans isomerase B (cyclophilin B)